MKTMKQIEVFMEDQKVGTLGLMKNNRIAFEYDKRWLQEGFSISPFSLPLEDRVFVPNWEPFGGIHGVFFDSLPDGWGRLLVDRLLLGKQIDPSSVHSLHRLAIVADSGMGALNYHPTYESDAPPLAQNAEVRASCSIRLMS